MLQREHSAILSTSIKLPVVIKTFVLSFFEWPFYTNLTVFVQSVSEFVFNVPPATKVIWKRGHGLECKTRNIHSTIIWRIQMTDILV